MSDGRATLDIGAMSLDPSANGSPMRLGPSARASPHFNGAVSIDGEAPEQYLARQNVDGLLEAFVSAVLNARPDDVSDFAVTFFSTRGNATTPPNAHSVGPLSPLKKSPGILKSSPSPLNASSDGPAPGSLTAHDRSTSPGVSGPPSTRSSSHVKLLPDAAPNAVSDPAALSTRSAKENATEADPGMSSSVISPMGVSTTSTRSILRRTSQGSEGAGLERSDQSTAAPKQHRPNKRTLKRMFPAPPVEEFEFDVDTPPRDGHYGVVRRAVWRDHGTVAVKVVPVEAAWTLDELQHLRACQAETPVLPNVSPESSVSPRPRGQRRRQYTAPLDRRWDIVKCYQAFYDAAADKLWYVFEWVEHTLDKLVDARRAQAGLASLSTHVSLPAAARSMLEREAAYVVRALLQALGHVHSSGRVHLDVKPANILIRRRTLPSASASPTSPSSPVRDGSDATASVGTPRFPEKADSDQQQQQQNTVPSIKVRRIKSEVEKSRQAESALRAIPSPEDYDVVLADFGTAQELRLPLQQLGDFKYMSPEVYAAADIPEDEGGVTAGAAASDVFREANDVWSVGCVAIFCIEGFNPIEATEAEWFAVMRSCWVQPALQHPQLWSPQLNSFLSLCFERDARLRPTTEVLLTHEWLAVPDEDGAPCSTQPPSPKTK